LVFDRTSGSRVAESSDLKHGVSGLAKLLERTVQIGRVLFIARLAVVSLELAGQTLDVFLEPIPCIPGLVCHLNPPSVFAPRLLGQRMARPECKYGTVEERGHSAVSQSRGPDRSSVGAPRRTVLEKRDEVAWSIPKGEIEPGENAIDVARREFEEELVSRRLKRTSCRSAPCGKPRQGGACLASPGDFDMTRLNSVHFEMEWRRARAEAKFPGGRQSCLVRPRDRRAGRSSRGRRLSRTVGEADPPRHQDLDSRVDAAVDGQLDQGDVATARRGCATNKG